MSDRCFRVSINNIPEDQLKLRNSNIPFFFSVEFQKESVAVPTVVEPLVRCEKCKAYLNPYAEVIMPGIKWRCNLCENVNEVKEAFAMKERRSNDHPEDPLMNAEFNRTFFEREDLRNDIFEIEAPESFVVKTPDPPVLCFVIEASLEAHKLGVLGSVLNCIREILRSAEYDRRTRVCFLFFNELAYMLNNDQTMTVISGEIPMILPDSILFSLTGAAAPVGEIDFARIERYFEDRKSVHVNPLLPLRIAAAAFRSASLFLFVSTTPDFGASKVLPSTSLVCKNNEYKTVSELLFRKNVCVNLFILARSNVEYATICILAQQTGGQTFHYSNYDGTDPVSSSKLFCDLTDYFVHDIGFGAVCRVRASDGTVLRAMHGNFSQKAADLFGYANFNPAHSINFSVTLFSSLKRALYVQVAMIRVNKHGQRLIRVFNICIPVTSASFYTHCDPNAICHSLLLDSFYYEGRKKLGGGEYMHNALVSICKELQENCGQIPESLASLPLLVLACRKSIVLRPDLATPTDFRAFYMYLFANSYIKTIDLMIYPMLLNLSDSCVSPLALSVGVLDAAGLYLLDTGVNIFFFIGKACDALTSASLFESQTSGPILFAPPDNDFSRYVSELIVYLTGDRPVKPRFILVNDSENSIYSSIFFSYLYDDKMYLINGIADYRSELTNLIR